MPQPVRDDAEASLDVFDGGMSHGASPFPSVCDPGGQVTGRAAAGSAILRPAGAIRARAGRRGHSTTTSALRRQRSATAAVGPARSARNQASRPGPVGREARGSVSQWRRVSVPGRGPRRRDSGVACGDDACGSCRLAAPPVGPREQHVYGGRSARAGGRPARRHPQAARARSRVASRVTVGAGLRARLATRSRRPEAQPLVELSAFRPRILSDSRPALTAPARSRRRVSRPRQAPNTKPGCGRTAEPGSQSQWRRQLARPLERRLSAPAARFPWRGGRSPGPRRRRRPRRPACRAGTASLARTAAPAGRDTAGSPARR